MKPVLPFLALALAVASCTTPYKSGQTPDDVYYSPGKPEREYVRVDEQRQERPRAETREDRYLRMRVRNRDRWAQFDDYYSDPYAYRYNCWCESNPRLAWGYYYSPYSPYYHGYAYIPLRPATPNRPRNYHFESFKPVPQAPVYSSGKPEGGYENGSNSEGGSTRGNTRGGGLRTIFNGSSQNGSSSSSSSGSSSSGSTAPRNAPVRRF
ncbi:MAG: hypothetical protein EOO08_05070 [Chitinophagaceae bacterium]|nr:MAG: hypothetical protein EOO08_05070 [Chitinophagaceae bacterium]